MRGIFQNQSKWTLCVVNLELRCRGNAAGLRDFPPTNSSRPGPLVEGPIQPILSTNPVVPILECERPLTLVLENSSHDFLNEEVIMNNPPPQGVEADYEKGCTENALKNSRYKWT